MTDAAAALAKIRERNEERIRFYAYPEYTVEHDAAEGDVRRSEDRLRLVIETIPQQIWSGPPDGSLDFCNAQWRSYTGLIFNPSKPPGDPYFSCCIISKPASN